MLAKKKKKAICLETKTPLNISYWKKKLCEILKYVKLNNKNASYQYVCDKTNVILKMKYIIPNIFTRK